MAVHYAHKGYNVIGVDVEQRKLELIRKGRVPFFEPDLERKLEEALENRKLRVVDQKKLLFTNADIVFITVGTPSLSSGDVGLGFLKKACKNIGLGLKKKKDYSLIAVRSTVPPGTTENLVRPIIEQYSQKVAGSDFGLVMSPEFLREGSAMYDVAHPDRVIIGELDGHSGDVLARFNREVYGIKVKILRMSLASAELAKYASNAFLATKISFINQVANMCEKIAGVDIVDVACAMGLDPRIGSKFLDAGAGWGGSCFPKDTKGLIALSRKLGYRGTLIEQSFLINAAQAKHMVELAEEELGSLKDKKIALLGLSFKPNTDDIREAPSLRIIKLLLAKKARVKVFDPLAIDNVKEIFKDTIAYSASINDCLEDADCCMLVTEWKIFRKLKPEDFVKTMRNPMLIDGRRIYNPKSFSKLVKLRAIGLCKNPRRES